VPLAKGPFDLDDYIDAIIAFFEKLGPGTHVMAVCQPSVPVLAAVSIMAAESHPAQPLSMTLMGGPIDTRANPTKVNEMATGRPISWFENTVIARVPFGAPGAGRRVYPGFLQLSGFMSMNLDRHVGAHVRMFEHLVQGDGDGAAAHRRFYDEYMSVMDLPAEYYLQTVKTVFQDHALPEGAMVSRGRRIDPGAIAKTALMTVEGEHDDISGLGQTRAAHALCSGLPEAMHRHYEQDSVGHYGIFNGRRWRRQIMPRVADFIAAFDS
jgi:poly(3-hydroxybutyrate) depolymerase